jgi:ATP-dependent helicase/nuclease subunit B
MNQANTLLCISASQPFLRVCAQHIIRAHGADSLASCILITPNQRVSRQLLQTLQMQSEQQAILSPLMLPIGGWKREDLLALFAQNPDAINALLAIPLAMDEAKRQSIYAKQILAFSKYLAPFAYMPRALKLADSLMQMHDQFLWQRADLQPLHAMSHNFKNANSSEQAVQCLFSIILKNWPDITAEMGEISQSEHQLMLQKIFQQYLSELPNTQAVYLLGSSGSIASTRVLMQAVSQHSGGHIILPGCATLNDHAQAPQFLHLNRSLAQLEAFEIDAEARSDSQETHPLGKPKAQQIIAQNSESEAQIIALIAKEHLALSAGHCLIITPDGSLMRRVAIKLQSLGIIADTPPTKLLADTPHMQALSACGHIITGQCEPHHIRRLMGLMQLREEGAQKHWQAAITAMDMHALREQKSGDFIETTHQLAPEITALIDDFMSIISRIKAMKNTRLEASSWLESMMAEMLKTASFTLADTVEMISKPLASYDLLGEIRIDEWLHLLDIIGEKKLVNAAQAADARVRILSPIEARLMQADCVILASFHSAYWPKITEQTAWMGQYLRKALKLPNAEDEMALAAHDIWMHSHSATTLYVTRAIDDKGKQTLTSPLENMLELQDCSPKYRHLAQAQFKPDKFNALAPARPKPPQAARLKPIRISSLNHLMQDPYYFYAQSILNLSPLNDYGQNAQIRDLGTLAHALMQYIMGKSTENKTERSVKKWINWRLEKLALATSERFFWQKRLHLVAQYAMDLSRDYDAQNITRRLEEAFAQDFSLPKGQKITLKGKIDMLETHVDGGLHVVDYKTGGHANAKQIRDGKDAQIFAYALLLQEQETMPQSLSYIKLPDVKQGHKTTEIPLEEDDFLTKKTQLLQMLEQMISAQTPFLAHPLRELNIDLASSDYDGINRIAEWG